MKRSLALALLLAPSSVWAAGEPTLLSSSGCIEVRAGRNHPFVTARAGDKLRFGATVRCPAGCELSTAKNTTLSLSEGASITLEPPAFVPLVHGGLAIQAPTVSLLSGRVVATAGEKAALMIRAGALDAIASAGRAEIVADASHWAIGSREGLVRVRTHTGTWSDLAMGRAAILRGGWKPELRSLIEPPAWATAKRDPGPWPIAFTEGEQGARVGSLFEGVAAALGYRVSLSREDGTSIGAQELPSVAREFTSEALPAGSYFARAQSIDADGLSSVDGATRALRVLRSEVPSGAALVDGNRRAVLPEGTSIHFDAVSGLEVAVERRVVFGPLPAHLSLTSADDTRMLWIRAKGDDSTASPLVLERRALKASIEISPRLPTWPRDPLVITVSMEDPSGRWDPSAITPHFRVLIGISEIPVAWMKDGAKWQAYVKPRSIHDYEVVRVLVADEHDAPLGRSFVEVIPPTEALAKN